MTPVKTLSQRQCQAIVPDHRPSGQEATGKNPFAATNALLEMLGFTAKSYQETKRIGFVLDGARLEIGTWPRIPPYLKIEAASKQEMIRIAELLGYTEAHLTGENTIKIYARPASISTPSANCGSEGLSPRPPVRRTLVHPGSPLARTSQRIPCVR
ncbi:hypothetical protein ACRS6B_23825 [Nocardia asteroides]